MKKKGFVLIGSIFLVLFLGIFLSIAMMRFGIQLQAIELRRAAQQAFYVAESALESAVNQLREDSSWRAGYASQPLYWQEGTTTELVGTYSLVAVDGADLGGVPTVWLRATGRDADSRVTREIRARVTVQNPASFFLSTAADLIFGSGATITGNILARDVAFEVNTAIPTPADRRITINGDLEYIRNCSGAASTDVVINGSVTQRDPTAFADVNLTRYQDLAQTGGRVVTGDFTYAGPIDWTTLGTGNGVLYVNGDVHLSGEVQQSVNIVATGNIYIEDDLVAQTGGAAIPQICLQSAQNVYISQSAPSNLTVNAYLVADGGVIKALGVPGSKGTLDFAGSAMAKGSASERTGISLNVYSTRNYAYDTDLVDNLSIPYMTYMINVLNWAEMNLDDAFPPAG
jgi:type II secretory pathway pseudopilin PulG